jgi:hypothetical protein
MFSTSRGNEKEDLLRLPSDLTELRSAGGGAARSQGGAPPRLRSPLVALQFELVFNVVKWIFLTVLEFEDDGITFHLTH